MSRRTLLFCLPALIPIGVLILFVMQFGMSPYPYADTTIANADTAILTADNSLAISDLFTPHYRHRVVFTRLVTAMLTPLTAWDVRYEVVLNVVLGIINCGLLAVLLWRFWGKFAPLLLFISTFLMLNLDQALNWLSGLQTSWGFMTLFTLLAIYLYQKPMRWRFMGAVLCGIGATFSLGGGIIIWGILLIMLILNQDKQAWRYVLILGVGGYFAFITLFGGGLDIQGNTYQSFSVTYIPAIIYLWLLMLGRPILNSVSYSLIPNTPRDVYFMVANHHWQTIIPSIIGILMVLYSLWQLYRHIGLKNLILPISISLYTLGGLGMIAIIIVFQSLTGNTDKIVIALNDRYIHLAMLFWVIVMSLIIRTFAFIPRKIRFLQAGFMSLILILHIITLTREIPYIGFNELAFPLDDALKNGECAQNYPLTGDKTCIYAIWMTDWDNLNQLASRRMTGYAQLPTQTILPVLNMDDGIVLNTESAWSGVHLRDFFFGDIPPDQFIHIAPSTGAMIVTDIQNSPRPPHLFLGDTPESHEAMKMFLTDKNGAWYVVRPPLYQGEALPAFRGDLEAVFVPAGYFITPENIQVTRYIRPFETTNIATFGGNITLLGYQFVGDADFGACDTITLQTAWQANPIPQTPIQLSLALTDYPITRAVMNIDAPVSPISIQFWEVDKPYYDERYLTIPCDLPSGEYALTITLYGISDGGEILPNLTVGNTDLDVERHLLVIIKVGMR
jgi:hypothetical protein